MRTVIRAVKLFAGVSVSLDLQNERNSAVLWPKTSNLWLGEILVKKWEKWFFFHIFAIFAVLGAALTSWSVGGHFW